MLMSAPVRTHWIHRLRKLKKTKRKMIPTTTMKTPMKINHNRGSESSRGMRVLPYQYFPGLRLAFAGRRANAKRNHLYFLDRDALAFDFDDAHPSAGRDVVPLRHDVEELPAELGFAGRPQRCHGDTDGAEQFDRAAV